MNNTEKPPSLPDELSISQISANTILDHLFEDLPETVIISDPQRRIMLVNSAATRLFRCDKSDLVGRCASVIYADEADFLEQGKHRYHNAAGNQHDRYLVTYRRHDGSLFTGESIGGPVHDDSGRVSLFMALIRDVTEKLASDNVLERLYDVTSNPNLSFEDSRHAILRLGCDYFGMPLGLVSRIDERCYEVLDAIDAHDEIKAGQIYDARETHCFTVVTRHGPYAADRATQPEICDHPAYRRFGIASYIGAPLYLRGDIIGAIAFSSSESTTRFTDHHLKLISMFGQWLSHEMERDEAMRKLRRARDSLRRVASRDELTGLGNRRELTSRFQQELERGRQQGQQLGIALIDFDHFKQINDRHGHAAGDAALKLFAQRSLLRLRSNDCIGRWGGEEFLLLLPDMSVDRATSVVQRLLDDMRSADFVFADQPIALTLSAGLTLTDCSEDIDVVVRRADKALYQAKTAGRDRLALS